MDPSAKEKACTRLAMGSRREGRNIPRLHVDRQN